jgi:hypothetical protein
MDFNPPLTIAQVAALLNVKESWIYSRTCDGKLAGTGRGRKSARKSRHGRRERAQLAPIPHYKIGALLRFDRAKVLAWWAQFERNGEKPSVNQPEGEEKAQLIQ